MTQKTECFYKNNFEIPSTMKGVHYCCVYIIFTQLHLQRIFIIIFDIYAIFSNTYVAGHYFIFFIY